MPKTPGLAETFVLRGLTPVTTYYVAIKVGDEVPNFSPISNVVTFTTPVADLTAARCRHRPAPDRHAHPGGVPDVDCPGGSRRHGLRRVRPALQHQPDRRRQLRRRDAGDRRAGARRAGHEADPHRQRPAAPTRSTTSRSRPRDNAEPANVSLLSNVVSGRTMPPVAPVTVDNPWISNDRVADCRTLQTMAATFDKAYTPDGVIAADPADIETAGDQLLQQLQAPLVPLGPDAAAMTGRRQPAEHLRLVPVRQPGRHERRDPQADGPAAADDLDRQRRPHLLRGRLQRQVALPWTR